MSKSFLDRRLESPDYEIEVWIRGIRYGNTGSTRWIVNVEGESDCEVAAEILEKAAKVLRDKT